MKKTAKQTSDGAGMSVTPVPGIALFNDNRLGLAGQKNLVQMIRCNPTKQESMSSALQLKTRITHKHANFKYTPIGKTAQENEVVGAEMEAWLDPHDPVKGSAADEQDDLMASLKAKYGLKPHELIKGHLLNHDLGGFGTSVNLFPITKTANGEHLYNAENTVKGNLYDSKLKADSGLYYKVHVISGFTEDTLSGSKFVCNVKEASGFASGNPVAGKSLANVTINSDVAAPSGKYAHYVDDETGKLVEQYKSPKTLPNWHHGSRKGLQDDWDGYVTDGKINVEKYVSNSKLAKSEKSTLFELVKNIPWVPLGVFIAALLIFLTLINRT